MVLFTLFCYYCYEQGLAHRNRDFIKLKNQYALLQTEEKMVLELNQKLMKQFNSQSDPEWLELALMKGLGVAPEGQIKVLFTEPAATSNE